MQRVKMHEVNKVDFPLRELRFKMMLSQLELAKRLGINQSTISRTENKRSLSLKEINSVYLPALILFETYNEIFSSIMEKEETK